MKQHSILMVLLMVLNCIITLKWYSIFMVLLMVLNCIITLKWYSIGIGTNEAEQYLNSTVNSTYYYYCIITL